LTDANAEPASPGRRFATFGPVAGRLVVVVAMLLPCLGCPAKTESPPQAAALPFAGQSLSLLVADDPDLAAAIGRLAGEWEARTGATVSIAQCSRDDLTSAQAPRADAVIYPSAELSALAIDDRLAPLPAAVVDDPQLKWDDVFPAIRYHETTWNERIVAVPYGSPVLVCYYRADLFEQFARRPPETWSQFQELAAFFADRTNLAEAAPPADRPWCGAIEPLAPGWAGVVLLARAASYAKHPYFHSTLFQIDTMQPRIDAPPFVRALEELAASSKFGPTGPARYDPGAAREAFWRGECAVALTWPRGTRGGKLDQERAENAVAGFCQLPGSDQVFDPADERWEPRPDSQVRHVPLLSIAGRLGSVLRGTPHEAAAAQMLLSLASAEWTDRLAGAGDATTLFRADQVRAPRKWVEREADAAAAARYAAVVEQALSSEEALSALRLPGRARYLAELDKAVEQALSGQQSPADALRAAAAQWQAITAELGVDRQRRAYRLSLGQAP
jgi:ABC-type glycerol-3-phosphate transport system substrate-binding protein